MSFNVLLRNVACILHVMLAAIKDCNTLPTIQSAKQNGNCSLDIQAMQVGFEVVSEIRECVWIVKTVEK